MTHAQPPRGHRPPHRGKDVLALVLVVVAVLLLCWAGVEIAESVGLVAGPDGAKIVRRG